MFFFNLCARNYKSCTMLFRNFCNVTLNKKHFVENSKITTLNITCLKLFKTYHKENYSSKTDNRTFFKNNKLQVGDEYENGKLLYIGANKGALKRSLAMMYSLGLGMAIASPYLFGITAKSTFATCFISFVVIMFVANPIGLYQFGKRHVNELYLDKRTEKYTATVLSPFIFKDKRITFTSRDCKMPTKPTAFTSFFARKHPMFINSDVMNYEDYMAILKCTTNEYDYENPIRQQTYNDVIQKALNSKQQNDKKNN